MLHAWRENVPGHRIRSMWWPLDVASLQKKKGKKTKKSHCSSFSCSKRVVHHFLWLYSYEPYYVTELLLIHIREDANFMLVSLAAVFWMSRLRGRLISCPIKSLLLKPQFSFITSVTKDNIFLSRHCLVLKGKYFDITIYLTGFDTRCLHVLCRQPSLRRKNSSSPGHPWHLWLVNPSPPPPRPTTSSATSNMIMSQSIHLAGLAHGEKSLALNCFLTWDCNQSDKISPPQCPLFLTQKRLVTHPLLALGLRSPIGSLDFFGFPGLMLACSRENLVGIF